MKQKTVKIGGIEVAEQYPVRISAEISTYFGKDIGIAKEYIDIAKEVGCEFLKGEILHDLSIIHDDTMPHKYMTDDGAKTENYRSLLARKQVSLKDYEKIFKYAQDKGMPIVASVYDMKGLDFLVSIGAAAAKVASQNLVNRPLIEHCAKSGLPLIMDTGDALLHEIAAAVQWAEDKSVKGIVLHHRPDGNPCPAEKHDMRILKTLSDVFGWPVGLSCHYDGDEMIYLAIGMGARVIEKPLYHKKERDDQDTMFAMTYDQFKEMVKKVRNCSAALGSSMRRSALPEKLQCRPCLVPKEDIATGTPLSLDNVIFAWPMKGICASLWNEAEGLVALKDLKKDKPIQWADLGSKSK